MSLPVLLYLRYFFDCFAMFMITKTKHSEARCLFVRLWAQYLSLSFPALPFDVDCSCSPTAVIIKPLH